MIRPFSKWQLLFVCFNTHLKIISRQGALEFKYFNLAGQRVSIFKYWRYVFVLFMLSNVEVCFQRIPKLRSSSTPNFSNKILATRILRLIHID